MVKAIIKDRLYIKAKHLDEHVLDANYIINEYKENACAKCPYLEERPGDNCEGCINNLGSTTLYKTVYKNGIEYIGLPPGNLKKLKKLFDIDEDDIDDRRPIIKIKNKIKFTGTLRDGSIVDGRETTNQIEIVDKWFKKKTGILKLPPRSGKCIVGSSLIRTNKGLLPIKDLFDKNHKDGETIEVVNLKVMTEKGYKQVSHLYKKTVDNTIKITTQLGYSIQGTPIHPVLIFCSDLKFRWKKLQDVKIDDYVCLPKSETKFTSKSVNSELVKLFGFLIANGSIGNNKLGCHFHTNNTIIQKEFIRCFNIVLGRKLQFKLSDKGNYYVDIRKKEMDILQNLGLIKGVSKEKQIPKIVMKADKQGLLDYLSAYLSCDSYAAKSANEIELCTASKIMAQQLHIQLASLGIHGRIEKYKSYARNSNNPVNRNYYSLFFNGAAKEKLLTSIKWYKPVQKYIFKNDNKYLLDGVPYVRHKIIDFIRHNSSGRGRYFYKGQSIAKAMPFGGTFSKNLIARSQFNKVNWQDISQFITKFDITLAKRIKKLTKTDFIFTKIVNISKIEKPIAVYDLCVPATHSFIANGMVVHNTVIGTHIACRLGVKTIIIAEQEDYLRQFRETFLGGKTRQRCTNAKTSQIKMIEKISDFDSYPDVALVNYKKFIREGSTGRIAEYINGRYTLLIVDEIHGGGAFAYSQFLSKLTCRYRVGLTATLERKDGKDRIITDFMGPIVAKSKISAMVPEINLWETGFGPKSDFKVWPYYINWLSKNEERNKAMVKRIFERLREGHPAIIVPVERVNHIKVLVDMINKYAYDHEDEFPDEKIAIGFKGASEKKKILDALDSGKYKVLVAIQRMIKQGIDLAVPTYMLLNVPMSGSQIGAPMFYQLSNRVATYVKGKRQPVVDIMVDNSPQAFYCFKSLFWTEIVPGLKNTKKHNIKYKLNKTTQKRMYDLTRIYNFKKYIPPGKTVNAVPLRRF